MRLLAQESVHFDLPERSSWEDGLPAVLFFGAVYLIWRILLAIIVANRAEIPWDQLARWYPSTTMSLFCLTLLCDRESLAFMAVVVVGLPASVLAVFVLILLEDTPELFAAFASAAAGWVASYAIIRWIEARAWATASLSLGLRDPRPHD